MFKIQIPARLSPTRSNGDTTKQKLSFVASGGILGYLLSYPQVTEMMNERGLDVDHTTGAIMISGRYS